jgi:hypothetical protein
MKPLNLRSYGTQGPKLGLTYHIDLNHIKTLFLVQLNLNIRIIHQAFLGIFIETIKLTI